MLRVVASYALVAIRFCVAVSVVACGDEITPAGPGDACSAARGCDEGLTCREAICVSIDVTGVDGTDSGDSKPIDSNDGGGEEVDGGMDGGKDPEPDAGGETDAGGDSDAGSDAGTCGPCDKPWTPCHARIRTCVAGACEYEFVNDAACDDQNPCTVADTCSAGKCVGTLMVCKSPPVSVCISETELRTYDQSGACNGGLCVHAPKTITCDGKCENGACQTDPCSTIQCKTPPNICYSAQGVCNAGSCTLPYANGVSCNDGNACTDGDSCESGVCRGAQKPCDAPPPNKCENESTLRVYPKKGGCAAGSCDYPPSFVSCANGCANGACVASGWMVMKNNVTVDLLSVWGSSPNSVWAGGKQGALARYNGTTWQARSMGATWDVTQIHGTAANNVFALGQGVHHYDGTSWTKIAAAGSPVVTHLNIFATGNKDVLVFGSTAPGAGGTLVLARFQFLNGGWQSTTLAQNVFRRSNFGMRMWADSATSVYLPGANYWDGTTVKQLAPATNFPSAPGRMWKSGGVVYAQDWVSGDTHLLQYDAPNDKWIRLATGFGGTMEDFHGPNASRIFLVGTLASAGHVLWYDGVGWTDQALPSGVGRLRAVWALPSGEVFAVGNGGLILTGP